jgi:hypothetical protein
MTIPTNLILISKKVQFIKFSSNDFTLPFPNEIQTLITNFNKFYNHEKPFKRSFQIISQLSSMTIKLSNQKQSITVNCSFLVGLILYHISKTPHITVFQLSQALNVHEKFLSGYLTLLLNQKPFCLIQFSDIKIAVDTTLDISPNINFKVGTLYIFPIHPSTILLCFIQEGNKEAYKELRWKYYEIMFMSYFNRSDEQWSIDGVQRKLQIDLSRYISPLDITKKTL